MGDTERESDPQMDLTGFTVGQAPGHRVRYSSGDATYAEALDDGRWVGRGWSASGRINSPDRRDAAPAFELAIKDEPEGESGPVSDGWQWESSSEAPRTDRAARHLVVELSNTLHAIGLKVHTLLDGTPVLTRWVEITNTSDEPFALTSVAPWSGRLWARGTGFTLGYQAVEKFRPGPESIATSGWFEWDPLPDGKTLAQSIKGNSQDDPFFVVRSEDAGEYFIGHLAWTANWRMEFERGPKGLSFTMGPWAEDALRVVAPGETIKTPAVHLGHVEGDLDSTIQAMHDHVRRSVLPVRKPERAYRMEFSIPGDQGYHTGAAFNEASLLRSVDVAAAIGMELFIVDAGWWDVYGEFVPPRDRFPRGLEPVADYAHAKGLLFGLYTEVEGGRGNWSESRLAQEHPDWFGPQNVMRIDRPEVAAYVEGELLRVIDRYGLDLYRHDFIPAPSPVDGSAHTHQGPSTLRDGFVESNYWRYYESYYAIWERIRARYPDLVLQMCSNGGWREDLDMMGRFHETYTSEGTLPRVLPPYAGKTVALPPEVLAIGYKDQKDSQLRVTFSITPPWILSGTAPSVEELSPERRERYLHYADIYRFFIRPLWGTCRVYHHAPVSSEGGVESSAWFAIEYAAPDRTKGWATIVRLGASRTDTYLLKPKGLDRDLEYRVTFDSTNATTSVAGTSLVEKGLPIRLEEVEASELVLFEAM